MPYAIIENGVIKNIYPKPNPHVRLKPSERLVEYNPPDVDLRYATVTPVVDQETGSISFTVVEKPSAAAKRLEDFISKVDADVDKLYELRLGSRDLEYRLAEQDAFNYQSSGFAGQAPESVSAYALSEGLTERDAAESILQKAQEWREIVLAVRVKRMEVKGAAKSGDLDGAFAAWSEFVIPII